MCENEMSQKLERSIITANIMNHISILAAAGITALCISANVSQCIRQCTGILISSLFSYTM